MDAYEALVQECQRSMQRRTGAGDKYDAEWLAWHKDRGDIAMLNSFGAFTRPIADLSGDSVSGAARKLAKDDRVISTAPGRGTCRRWWPKGLGDK